MHHAYICILSLQLLLFILGPKNTFGQSSTRAKEDSITNQSKDIVDLIHLEFKTPLRRDSAEGKKPFFSVIPVVGYSMQSGLTGAIITNASFYTDASKSRFSNLLINGYYSEFHQYWFTANSSLFFEKYKLHLVGDMRYYKFPTQTYGIGTNTTLSDALNINYTYLRINQLVLFEIKPNFFIGGGINHDSHWNIGADTISGKALTDLRAYQNSNHSNSTGISLNTVYDSRKNPENPSGGSYGNIQYRPNMTFLGSDNNWQSLVLDLRHYIKLPASSSNILAFWNYYNFTLDGTPPYLDLPSIGWDAYSNTGRGYAPGRYTGKNLMYFESEYRFVLSHNGLLGGVVFGNMQDIYQNWSDKHAIIPGAGIGLRLKMNKYSNTNLGIDYGFGVGGSHGLFFNLGEVF